MLNGSLGSVDINQHRSTGSSAQEEVYRDVLGEYSQYKNHVNTLHHFLIPTHTLHAAESIPGDLDVVSNPPLKSPFPFRVYRPLPLLPPAIINPDIFRLDPLNEIVAIKRKWEHEMQILLGRAKKGKKWAEEGPHPLFTGKVKKKDESKPIYSVNHFVKVANHLKKEPYPCFTGEENWMATGGCVAHCTLDSYGTMLLVPRGKHMDSLRIVALMEDESNSWCYHGELCDVALIQGQRIYEIVAAGTSKKGIVVVRQEKGCSIVQMKSSSGSSCFSAHSVLEIQEPEGIFTSIDIGNYSDHQFCTLDGSHTLKHWDINSSSCVQTAEVQPKTDALNIDNWGCVRFTDNKYEILCANRKTVSLKDLRIPLTKSVCEYSPAPVIDDCEKLTLVMGPRVSPLTYVATSHRLLSLDLRSGWVQRWTHLLRCNPLYGSVRKRECEEVVILNSCAPDDTVVVINSFKNDKPISRTLPATLPSVNDCLLWARIQGECLGPSFGWRLESATVGISILPPTKAHTLVSVRATSIGDVFSQMLTAEPTRDNVIRAYSSYEQNERDIAVWKKWEQAHDEVCADNNPELPSETYSNSHIFEVMKSQERTKETDKRITKWHSVFPKKQRNGILNEDLPEWSETVCQLSGYKDLMAAILLEAWDTDDHVRLPDTQEYVQQWLGHFPSSIPRKEDYAESVPSCRNNATLMSSIFDTSDMENSEGHNKNNPDFDDSSFKTPKPPKKRIKRESIGF